MIKSEVIISYCIPASVSNLLIRDQRTNIGLISLFVWNQNNSRIHPTRLPTNMQHNMVERLRGNVVMSRVADCLEVLESGRGKAGQFPVVVWSPARPQHTPNIASEESNPSVEVHRRKRRGGGVVQHWAKT